MLENVLAYIYKHNPDYKFDQRDFSFTDIDCNCLETWKVEKVPKPTIEELKSITPEECDLAREKVIHE